MALPKKNKIRDNGSAVLQSRSNNRIKYQAEPGTSLATRKTKRKVEESNITEPEETPEGEHRRRQKKVRHHHRVKWKPEGELVEIATFDREQTPEDSSSEAEVNHEADRVIHWLTAEPLEDGTASGVPEDDTSSNSTHPGLTAMWEVVHEGARWKMDLIQRLDGLSGQPRDHFARRKWRKLKKEKPGIYEMLRKENKYLNCVRQESLAQESGNKEKKRLRRRRLLTRHQYAFVIQSNGYERWGKKEALQRESKTPGDEVEDDSTSSSHLEEEMPTERPKVPYGYPNDELESWRARVRRKIEDQQLGKDDSDEEWSRQENLMYEKRYELYTIKMEHDAYLEQYKKYHIALHFPKRKEMEVEMRNRRRLGLDQEPTNEGGKRRKLDFCTIWKWKILQQGEIQGLDEEHQEMWRRIKEAELREKKPALWRLLKREHEQDYWLEKASEGSGH
ncbi:hypothetical protein F53441_1296 [Fusarium austroafricanum]|uniref:Uncharacterized protein n=1 Tax=Fusarium austroafricanum TaxID=2364996 RepID=A0A8H4KVT7_9HYPO|nr:hypothetical protein F53441_1296 [Fusarium austroafricanum]